MNRLFSASLAMLALFCAPQLAIGLSNTQLTDLPNFNQVSPALYRGGQPTDQGMSKLKALGIKTIISLRHNHSQVLQEHKEADSLGIKFVPIPLDGLHKVSKRKISEFLRVVEDPVNQPVFVHCQFGQDRTGTLVAIYRQEVQKWSAKRAYDEMVSKGFETKYAWLADSVFDYEEDKVGSLSPERPATVKVLDSIQSAIGTRPNYKVRKTHSATASIGDHA